MKKNGQGPSEDAVLSPEYIPEKLDILGGAFSTIGDFLSTLATILALDELVIADKEAQKNAADQEERLVMMQKEIDDLKQELSMLKKSTHARL